MKQIIRTIYSVVAISAMTVIAASCAKDELSEEAQQRIPGVERTISATATLPQDPDKAHIDGSRKVIWDMGDELNINGTNVAISSIGPDGTTAKFDESTVHANTVSGTDHYWAVYPTTLAGAYSGGIPSNFTATSLTVNFPATQTYDASANALSGNTLMAGYASVPSGEEQIVFQMRNLGAVLKLHLTADASATNKLASRIEFSTTNGALAGDFTVDNSATPTVTPAAGAPQTLTVNLTDGTNNYIDIASGADIYVILPPMASKNLTMRVYNTDGGKSSKTASSTTLARNNIYTNTVSDICFCECGGGSPSFSVSATQQVVFAPGNLQWSATGGGATATTHAVAGGGTAPGTWRFAENQWEHIGNAAGNNTAAASRETQAAWIDHFGWGTSGYDNTANDPYAINYQPWAISQGTVNTTYNYYGYGPSTNMADPSLVGTSANYDWGVYNAIYNPQTGNTDPAGTWRTPTQSEWAYVLRTRTTCSGVRFAKATVNNEPGLIIVTDNWDVNTYALNNTNSINAYYNVNNISSTDWTNIFEAAGCAFLPAAGNRNGTPVHDVGTRGYYWSAAYYNSNNVYGLYFYSGDVNPSGNNYRYYGRSVRLVKEVH